MNNKERLICNILDLMQSFRDRVGSVMVAAGNCPIETISRRRISVFVGVDINKFLLFVIKICRYTYIVEDFFVEGYVTLANTSDVRSSLI